jgi:hypothetical protein
LGIKIVINTNWGGFNISSKAYSFIAKRKGWVHSCDNDGSDYWNAEGLESLTAHTLNRDDIDLVDAVTELGDAANTNHSELKVVEIPKDVSWIIQDYDGIEWIAEHHRTWR